MLRLAASFQIRCYAQRSAGVNSAGPSPPQIIARLLELFPDNSVCVPARKWAPVLPDDVNEVLAGHGGLTKFTGNHPNFFSVIEENGAVVIKLTGVSKSLVQQKKFKDEKRREKEAQKLSNRRY